MSSNSNLEIVNLDFPTLKNSLKKYLSAQAEFKDYDFEGSNINVLMDVLAYNTYMNSFYLNMVASEMFLDSAQIRDSVISHAKELNYLPRSFRSAKAVVDLTITPTTSVDTVTVLKGTSFTSRVGSNTYSFIVDENMLLASDTGVFVANNVVLYEGALVSETFIYDSLNTTQQLIISNPTVDTTSIAVYVYEDNGQNVLTYERGSTFLGLNANSQVFFVQPARGDRYEIVFGNGAQGRRPKDGSAVVVGYRSCSGELPNGAAIFSPDSTIDGHANVVVSTVNVAEGGSIHESLQDIKRNAPRYFQTQERAVTVNDYKIALQTQFPEIDSISVYGGEDADPPQYGRVFICVSLENTDGVPAYKKQIYKSYIKTLTPLSIDPVFIDPEFMYLQINTDVKYNINTLQVPENSLQSLISSRIQIYNQQYLDDFDVVFRYSRFTTDIDNADASVLSNETQVSLYKEIVPSTTKSNSYVLNFFNELEQQFTQQTTATHRSQDAHSVYSSTFTFNNQICRIEDDNVGGLFIVAIVGDTHVKVRSVGEVDYATGKVAINNFQPTSYGGGAMRIFVSTKDNDVAGLKNNILKIKPSDIGVTMDGVRR